ncbi:hypothetical protein MMC25_002505 [Agyrium rufum]|nr:hypothetical protein [Agyrium rufum]
MAQASNTNSTLSHYRLAILAATALAAGCSIYYIQKNVWSAGSSPGAKLHRSNAIHRRRRGNTLQSRTSRTSRQANVSPAQLEERLLEEGDYATFIFDSITEGRVVELQLSFQGLKKAEWFQHVHGYTTDQSMAMAKDMETSFLEQFFLAYLRSREQPTNIMDQDRREILIRFSSHGLDPDLVDSVLHDVQATVSGNRDGGIEGEPVPQNGTELDHIAQLLGQGTSQSRPGDGSLGDFTETLAEDAMDISSEPDDPPNKEAGQSLLNLLYYIAEDESRRSGYVHRGVTCNRCGIMPIRGIRYRCANCFDHDLCEQCESMQSHDKTHILYKIRIPTPFPFLGNPHQRQPVWYPGRPQLLPPNIDRDILKKYCNESAFDESEVNALYDQFRCLARTRVLDDELGVAIDHKTFNQCFILSKAVRPPPPNLLYNLIFAFYDTDSDDNITFKEFVMGLSCLRAKKLDERLIRIFRGYDLDKDGYVSRKDFLRMFRAYYTLMKEILLAGLEDDEYDSGNSDSRDVVTGSQPLSAAFSGSIPNGEPSRTGEEKMRNVIGDMELPNGQDIIRGESQQGTIHHDVVGDALERQRFGKIMPATLEDERRQWTSMLIEPSPFLDIFDIADSQYDDLPGDSIGDTVDFEESAAEAVEPTVSQEIDHDNERNSSHDNESGPSGSDNEKSPDEDQWPPQSIQLGDVEAALGIKIPIAEVQTEDRVKVKQATLARRRREAFQRRQQWRETGVAKRWQRRQFYLDEEEGSTRPNGFLPSMELGAHSTKPESIMNGHTSPSKRSRSSSKVRFEDDLTEEEARSRSSSISSRDRVMPESEREVGKEVLYQTVTEALNELLDPVFQDREDLAIEVLRTEHARSKVPFDRIYARYPELEGFIARQVNDVLRQLRVRNIASNDSQKATRFNHFYRMNVVEALKGLITWESKFVDDDENKSYFLSSLKRFKLDTDVARFMFNDVDLMDIPSNPSGDQTSAPESSSTPADAEEDLSAKEVYVDNNTYPEAAEELHADVAQFNAVDSALFEAAIAEKPLQDLLAESGYSATNDIAPETPTHDRNHQTALNVVPASQDDTPDPTLPQFRPNSDTQQAPPPSFVLPPLISPTPSLEVEDALSQRNSFALDQNTKKPATNVVDGTSSADVSSSSSDQPVPILPETPAPSESWHSIYKPADVKYLAMLEYISKDDSKERGGPGLLDFKEFEQIMTGEKGKTLGFVGAWIELASF